jgi:hypothetical protein
LREGNLLSRGCSVSETGCPVEYNDGKQDLRLIASPNVKAPKESNTKPKICSGMKASQPKISDNIPARGFRDKNSGKARNEPVEECTYKNGTQRVRDDAMASSEDFGNLDAKEIKKTNRNPKGNDVRLHDGTTRRRGAG